MSVVDVPLRNAVRVVLFAVDAFVAVTAAGGAVVLAFGWEGSVFPLELLRAASADGSLSRGLLLALAVSGSATIASLATLRGPRAAGVTSALAGVLLLSQLLSQLVLLDLPGRPSDTEAVYLTAGATMVTLGVLALVLVRTGSRQVAPDRAVQSSPAQDPSARYPSG